MISFMASFVQLFTHWTVDGNLSHTYKIVEPDYLLLVCFSILCIILKVLPNKKGIINSIARI